MTSERDRGPDDAAGAGIDNLTLWQRVHEHLRQEILSNRLPPGSELNEVALAQLARDQPRPAARGARPACARRGWSRCARGAARSSRALRPGVPRRLPVREALETLAIRLAVPRLGADELAHLRRSSTRWSVRRRGRPRPLLRGKRTRSTPVRGGVGQRDAAGDVSRLIGQMGRLRDALGRAARLLRRSTAEHQAILRAVRAGDADKRRPAARRAHPRAAAARSRHAPDEEASVHRPS